MKLAGKGDHILEIVLATRNRNKIKEISAKLKDSGIKILTLDDYKAFPEVIENRKTIEGNAAKKAFEVGKFTKKLSIADDTGLEVDYLKGAPGVYSARFAGKGCNYLDNNIKLLKLLQGVKGKERSAKFRTVIAIALPGGKILFTEGVCKGIIAEKMSGRKGFGYDPLFIPLGYKKTYAQMSLANKNRISHRGKALDKAKKILLKLIKTGA